MPFFYQVRDTRNAQLVYPCGPHVDPEAAVSHFNTEYGRAVGKTFTTRPVGTSSVDYVLVEQERPGSIGLRDVRSMSLYPR
jgi:hypothetical protein